MGISSQDRETLRRVVSEAVLGTALRRATFAGTGREANSPWIRVVVRPLELRGERQLQFSYYDARKDITKNYSSAEAANPLEKVLAIGFSGIHLSTETEEIDIRTTKKGKVLIGRRAPEATISQESLGQEHNRPKEVPLPEGQADHLLETMGIMTAEGRVRPTMRAKFTQINEFLKHLIHAMEGAGLRSLDREVRVLDCGCGASYLTLAVHHYLNEILGIPALITGVDVNEEVIRKSTAKAGRLSADRLNFSCGPIRGFEEQPDIVVALHACDTATDDAIALAIHGGAHMLLAVPCCHKDLNRSLRPEGETAVLRPVLRHGILRQRTADLVTDSFRALILRIMGYRTEIVEFVATEHTARNLLIRAVKCSTHGDGSEVEEYRLLRRFWNVTPYLEKLLGEPFRNLIGESP